MYSHCKEIRFTYSSKRNCAASVLIPHSCICERFVYSPIGPPNFLQQKIGRVFVSNFWYSVFAVHYTVDVAINIVCMIWFGKYIYFIVVQARYSSRRGKYYSPRLRKKSVSIDCLLDVIDTRFLGNSFLSRACLRSVFTVSTVNTLRPESCQ
jgi:hypothetical protein